MSEAPRASDRAFVAWGTPPVWLVAVLVVVLFALSLAIRADRLGWPLGIHHEEGTARTLVHSRAWLEAGPHDAGYLLRATLENPGDAFLTTGGRTDDAGVAYYVSLPPGHPLWMYAAHRVVGAEPTVASIRYVNLGLHLLTALLVFAIVNEALRRLPIGWGRIAGLAAFAAYLFSPMAMWYQSNAYTSASAVQPFFALALLLALRAYREKRPVLDAAAVGGAVALMSYTEWLGPAFAGVAVVFAIARRRDPVARRIALGAVGGAALALAVVAVQYAGLMGWDALADTVRHRYLLRSGMSGATPLGFADPESWSRLWAIFVTAIAPLAGGAAVVWIWDRIAGRGRARRFAAGDAPAAALLALALGPVLVHHVVLFNHTVVHDFDMLKTSLALSVMLGWLVGRLLARYATAEPTTRGWAGGGLVAVLVLVAGFSMYLFLWMNDAPEPRFEQLGTFVAERVEPEDVVFLDQQAYVPPSTLTYYSGRNFVEWSDAEQAARVLGRVEGRTGVVFAIGPEIDVLAVGFVKPDGEVVGTREALGQ